MSANSAAPATTAVASATPNAVAATSPTIRAAIEIRDRRSTAPSRYLVRERAHVNVWSWLQASLDSNIDLVKEQQVTGGESAKHLNEQAVCDMTQAKISARVAALRALGTKVKLLPGVDIAGFPEGSKTTKTSKGTTTQTIMFPAENLLLPCDTITRVDGHEIAHAEDVS